MIWDDITSPEKRVKRAMRKLFQDRNAQFWGSLGLTMGLIPVGDDCQYSASDVPTMATDYVNIYYNPEFVISLSEPECVGVLAHEISHPALRHKQRLAYLNDNNLANMAADYELNLDLDKAGLKLPAGVLLDYRFDGLSAEQIANVIRKENEKDIEQGKQPRHKPGSGNMLEPSNDDGSPMSSDQIAELHEQWEEKTNQALGAARKAGTLGGEHVPTSLQSVTASRSGMNIIDWRQPLRAFIDNLGSKYQTYSKLSRRALGRGQVLPGSKVIRPSKIAWIIDCSGSMDTSKNQQAAIEAQAALDDMAVDAIDVIYTDTRVKDIDAYEIGDTIKLRTYTGGGTDFAAVMAHVASDSDYVAIVFITDGVTRSWGTDPNLPTLWAITDSERATNALKPPFGDKLCLYTS